MNEAWMKFLRFRPTKIISDLLGGYINLCKLIPSGVFANKSLSSLTSFLGIKDAFLPNKNFLLASNL